MPLSLLVFVLVALGQPSTIHPQTPDGRIAIGHQERAAITIAASADGAEAPMFGAALAFSGLVLYDIASAPASARQYNRLHPDGARKSPEMAFLVSLAGTALPLVAGRAILRPGTDDDYLGAALIAAGAIVGPSAGHWYAERTGRGFTTVGIRVGLLGVFILAGRLAFAGT